MRKRAMNWISRASLVTGAAVALSLAPTLNANALPASPAATGGGCGNVLPVYGGNVRACISATSPGHGIFDGYVSYARNQPGCYITLRLWNSANQLLGAQGASCNNGTVGVHPSAGFSANSGNYHTTVEVKMTGRATVTAYSPGITMP